MICVQAICTIQIHGIAEKSPQHFGGNATMSAILTLWESLTKYLSITFITNNSDELPWLPAGIVSSWRCVYICYYAQNVHKWSNVQNKYQLTKKLEAAIKSPRTNIQQVADELKRNGGLGMHTSTVFFFPMTSEYSAEKNAARTLQKAQ